jgi:hypothetical protein
LDCQKKFAVRPWASRRTRTPQQSMSPAAMVSHRPRSSLQGQAKIRPVPRAVNQKALGKNYHSR